MRRPRFHVSLGAAILLLSACGTCVPSADENALSQFTQTIILATEHLYTPEVTLAADYRYGPAALLEPGDPSAGRVTGLALIVATALPDAIEVRLIPRGASEPHALARVLPPTVDPWQEGTFEPATLPEAARQELREGGGIFWVEPAATDTAHLERRVGVALPDALRVAFSRLEVFSSVAPDGTALGADSIRLAEEFFHMTVLGDSVLWGNGLGESDKIPSLVAEVIEARTGRRVISQVLALSGAKLVPGDDDGVCGIDCFRSAPYVATSLPLQLEIVEHPEQSDLVLVNGCINDVGLSRILSPETTADKLAERTAYYCGEVMADFLKQIRAVFPQSPIVVTGYYPIVSTASDLDTLLMWLTTEEKDVQDDLNELATVLAANSNRFDAVARESLRQAVDRVNTAEASAMIGFADPGFGEEHGIFAPQSWLWGLRTRTSHEQDEEIPYDWVPEDPELSRRIQACIEQIGTGPTIPCLYTSLGHPNRQGARAYAEAIVAALETLGVLEAVP